MRKLSDTQEPIGVQAERVYTSQLNPVFQPACYTADPLPKVIRQKVYKT